jgi:hypothetical protein
VMPARSCSGVAVVFSVKWRVGMAVSSRTKGGAQV